MMPDSSSLASPQPSLPLSPLSQLNQAITACENALKEQASLLQVCQTLGDVLQGMGRFQEAIFWHTAAREQQPNPASIYASLGRLCTRQSQWQQAIAYYEQATVLDQNFAAAFRSLGSLYAQQGQRLQAAKYRYQAVKLQPKWATPRNQLKLGNLLLEVNQPDQAIECYRHGIQLDPSLFQIHYNLAVALTSQERWQEAEAVYQQALEINPNHAESYYGLSKVAEQQNNLQTAFEYCQRAVELSPTSFAACYTLGTLLLKLNRWQEATAAYRQALELNPDFAWSYHNLGYALLKQGDVAEAIVKLRHAAKLLSDSPWTYYHLADALSQQEQWDEAIATLLNAIQLEPTLPGVYYKLGSVVRYRLAIGLEAAIEYHQHNLLRPNLPTSAFYAEIAAKLAESNQIDGAYFFYRLALHLQPNQPELYTQVEQTWAKREQLNQRIAELQHGIQQRPEHSWLYTELGNLLANQGETEKAIALHRQASMLRGWQRATTKDYIFTHDWFTHNIPVWTEHLRRFVNVEVNALEIGSFEGMSTCWFLDYILTHPNAQLTCIDLYFQECFDVNVAKTGSPEKIVKLVGDSHQLLATLKPESYDLIYIDGCHWADHAKQDAALSWKLLKPGGLIIFDDYEWVDPQKPGQDTKIGIDAFLASVESEVELVYQEYQVIVRKVVH